MKRPYLIEFDHHQPQEAYADLEIRLPDKASTTEIIYHFLQANNLPISKLLANCILIGLMTDTGHFLHANSSRKRLPFLQKCCCVVPRCQKLLITLLIIKFFGVESLGARFRKYAV